LSVNSIEFAANGTQEQPMFQLGRAERLLAYAIAGVAGFVDASGFLAADRYFVSFMSGNTTRLGVELASGTKAALAACLLLFGFVIGVTLGALLAERFTQWRKPAVLALSTLLLALGSAGAMLGSTNALMGCAVLAMGSINNVFRRDGEIALGVTYMTGALVRIGEGLAGWLEGSKRGAKGILPSLILWSSLAAGAILGALAHINLDEWAFWLATIWAAALFVAASILARHQIQSS
jgi:uncharacterized membrane protein YoaK (UPF0700 family)